jgi:inosine/xanthosine triphosphate pyrophosphatase family protein
MLYRITLITGNAGKAAEFAVMLGIDVTPAKAELTEVQPLDVGAVAARKAADAYAQMASEEKNKISHRRRAVEAMRTGLGLQ